MTYFVHTHCSDKLEQPELYKLNGISSEEKLENLLVFLSDNSEQSTSTIEYLPNNQDVMKNFLPPQKTNW